MRSDPTTRFVVRFTRTGSVMESTTIRAGIETDTRKIVNNVELMSNLQTRPFRMPSTTPGL